MKNMFRNPAPDNDYRHNPARRRVLRNAVLMLGLMVAKVRGAFAGEVEKIAAAIDDATHTQRTLAQVAFRLFPHENLPAEHYEAVAVALIGRASNDGNLAEVLETGVRSLDSGSALSWIGRSEPEQIEGIVRLKDSRFFSLMRVTTIEHLYRRKAVWDMIGYEGSSIEFGGYVNRGFDDIDWLPEVGSKR
jgi:hypothetical protein